MSYILDALKKSEQERGHGKIPGVQTMHSSSLNYRSDKRTYWPYILIVAVILNLLAIVYFIIDKDQNSAMIAEKAAPEISATDQIKAPVLDEINEQKIESSSAINEQDNNLQSAATATRVIDEEPPATAADNMAPPNTDAETAKPRTASRNTKANASAAAENIEVIEFYDLPESIKNQLPAIIISAHVFSTNPLQRSIVINNKFMEEGEHVIDDLMLLEITADGAIFELQGTRFHYGVVSSWQ